MTASAAVEGCRSAVGHRFRKEAIPSSLDSVKERASR